MFRIVPIKAAATALSLPVHEVDTFTGWKVLRNLCLHQAPTDRSSRLPTRTDL
jgi:hypothetical protein